MSRAGDGDAGRPPARIEAAVAAYRRELAAAAPLGDAELDELTDHLRDLIDELGADGRGAEAAIAAARARMGLASEVGRECARVRTGFAARLTAARAWSAALLVVGTTLFARGRLGGSALVWGGFDDGDLYDLRVVPWLALVCGAALVVALVRGRSLARVVLLGYLVGTVAWLADHWLHTHPSLYRFAVETRALNTTLLVALAGYGGAAALLAPWRRRELARGGWALALAAAALATPLHSTYFDHGWLSELAMIYGALGLIGLALRARWGCAVTALAAAALAVVAAAAAIDHAGRQVTDAWAGLVVAPAVDEVLAIGELVLMAAGAAAALAAAVLGWRRARAGLGDAGGLAA